MEFRTLKVASDTHQSLKRLSAHLDMPLQALAENLLIEGIEQIIRKQKLDRSNFLLPARNVEE